MSNESLLTTPPLSSSFAAGTGATMGGMFFNACLRYADRLAFDVAGQQLTYSMLARRAARLAAAIASVETPRSVLGAVYSGRTQAGFEGVLGILLAGVGYVSLNPKFPDVRNGYMLELSQSRTLVLDAANIERLGPLLACVTRPLSIFIPNLEDVTSVTRSHPGHRFLGQREIDACEPLAEPAPAKPSDIAYLIFTSGSTGTPKGVMVSHENFLLHLRAMWKRYELTEHDRVSQVFELTFDMSLFDMFVTWGCGASLHVVPESIIMAPDEFIAEKKLTFWTSVPAIAIFLRRLRRLRPGIFPALRHSLFCGERLPSDLTAAWQEAAPNSIVDNLYGPTETTLTCTAYRWDPNVSPSEVVDGVVPVGRPFPGVTVAVVDPELRLVPLGERGELSVSGDQLALGYWQDEAKTAERYVAMPWSTATNNRWYRTGDVGYVDKANGNLIHCGRNDAQLKIRSNRVELPEVEHALRKVSGVDFVAVVGYPIDDAGPSGLVAFIAGPERESAAILDELGKRLPSYMVPGEIVFIAEMPLNANGKTDRRRLLETLRARDQ